MICCARLFDVLSIFLFPFRSSLVAGAPVRRGCWLFLLFIISLPESHDIGERVRNSLFASERTPLCSCFHYISPPFLFQFGRDERIDSPATGSAKERAMAVRHRSRHRFLSTDNIILHRQSQKKTFLRSEKRKKKKAPAAQRAEQRKHGKRKRVSEANRKKRKRGKSVARS